MAKIEKPKKKARLAAIEIALAEVQEQLRDLDRKLDAHRHAHAIADEGDHHGETPPETGGDLNERLARLETKLDTLIEGLAQVEAGDALRGGATPDAPHNTEHDAPEN